jgi:hypothetical protein
LDEISGVILNIRRLNKGRLKTIKEADNYNYKKQLLEESKNFYEGHSFPFVNAAVFIEEKTGYNKFIAISGNYPIKVYLPQGEYKMSLKYPRFSLVDNNFNIVKYLNLSVDLIGELREEIILMVPNNLED